MLSNIGWIEILVLGFAGLFILGPERLPGAAAWLGRSLKQVREYATGARQQLKDELGPEFDELRKPLADLQQLRGLNPRTAIAKHLFDDDPNPLFSEATAEPVSMTKAAGATSGAGGATKPKTLDPMTVAPPLAAGERPPFDADAT